MRFGSFIFPVSLDQEKDHEVIENTLREVDLCEEIGMDAVWLTEHHFDGAVAYADPVVFAAAVATRTQRVRIGFAVVEMAMHHPVRLAAQTALLDNLSHGRLTVGTGKGSAYNEYEYIGFGVAMEDARDMLPEAEELLVKAWTEEDVRHEGRFWKSSFPILRPRPYQKPHPPLIRACITESSMVEMAKIGRPVLMGVLTVDGLRHRLQLYKDTMREEGFGEDEVERSLDQCWAQRALYVTDTDEEAEGPARAALERFREHLLEARVKWNPGGVPPSAPGQPPNPAEVFEHAFWAGSPERVSEQIAELGEAGVRNLLLNINVGQMPREQVESSLKLFGEKVIPRFRS